jgi:hypothetical protein
LRLGILAGIAGPSAEQETVLLKYVEVDDER